MSLWLAIPLMFLAAWIGFFTACLCAAAKGR